MLIQSHFMVYWSHFRGTITDFPLQYVRLFHSFADYSTYIYIIFTGNVSIHGYNCFEMIPTDISCGHSKELI